MTLQSDRPGRPILPMIMVAAGLVIIAGAILWGLNLIQTSSALPATSTPVVNIQSESRDVPRVSLEKAKQAYDQKTAVFIDIRDALSYASGHIPGAMSIPLADLGSRLKELKTSDWIITYCT